MKIKILLLVKNYYSTGIFICTTQLRSNTTSPSQCPFRQKEVDAFKCDHPRCHTCELAKAKRRAKRSTVQAKTTERDGSLKAGDTKVVSRVSIDHFEVRLKGRTCDSFGKPSSVTFKGSALFIDRASMCVHCEHQVGLSAVETIRAKQSYERFCVDNDVVIQDYLTDSRTFKANKFVSHIHETQQLLRFSGMNAPHQNGVAERSIQTISNMARAMILHVSMHWKEVIDSSMWPMEVNDAVHIYNNMPNNGVSQLTSSLEVPCIIIVY
jgi:hypothetical protein